MNHKLTILILSFSFFRGGFSQNVERENIDYDWFNREYTTIRVEIPNQTKNDFKTYHGDLKIIGWSRENYIAYIFSPRTTIACNSQEELSIVNLATNSTIWRNLACDLEWKNPKDRFANEFINLLDSMNFEPADSPTVYPANIHIINNDSIILIYAGEQANSKVLYSFHKDYPYDKPHSAFGYIRSPFNEGFRILIIPIEGEVELIKICAIE